LLASYVTVASAPHHASRRRAGKAVDHQGTPVGVDKSLRAPRIASARPSTWSHQAHVLLATEDRDHTTFERFAADLLAHDGDRVKVLDGWPPT
jgi:hypothetical protein